MTKTTKEIREWNMYHREDDVWYSQEEVDELKNCLFIHKLDQLQKELKDIIFEESDMMGDMRIILLWRVEGLINNKFNKFKSKSNPKLEVTTLSDSIKPIGNDTVSNQDVINSIKAKNNDELKVVKSGRDTFKCNQCNSSLIRLYHKLEHRYLLWCSKCGIWYNKL